MADQIKRIQIHGSALHSSHNKNRAATEHRRLWPSPRSRFAIFDVAQTLTSHSADYVRPTHAPTDGAGGDHLKITAHCSRRV
ncbi:hypothetical protein EVAR_23673_1 [Eumeta japonica]|uniref:Uncharacterized protein n=1 Tax=Eumeta variegata TaxID=151549 RepID=A0A4C1VJK1_EUMVA|nr:hypothetical protein EVAR_23673_1 [Eumeta japonica]